MSVIPPPSGNIPRSLMAVVLMLCSACHAPAQTTQPPLAKSFEVASIRIYQGDPQWKFATHGTRLTIEGFTLLGLVKEAYNLRNDQLQLTGADPLLRKIDVLYDIVAKAEGDASPSRDDFRQMLQSLLADRFHMKIHRQWKETPVYGLVVGKGGPKLRAPTVDPGPALRLTGSGIIWQLSLPHATMAELVQGLSKTAFLDRPVIDKTGLNGTFDIRLTFTPENRIARTGASNLAEISIFTALREQLGLRLQPQTATVEIVVLDHIEKPLRD